jgi:SprT-like family
MTLVTSSLQRQQWLEAAVEALRLRFADGGYVIPQKVRVAIGWPKRAASCGAIGECWAVEASSDHHAECFISPQLTEGTRILDVLAHELVHATMGSGVGHGPPFKRCALAG